MSASEKRFSIYAMTLWVFAMVALLGIGYSGGHASVLRKVKYLDGSGVNQIAVESPAVGNSTTPQVFLALGSPDNIRLIDPTSMRLGISCLSEHDVSSRRNGEPQGRAPPVVVSS